MMPELNSKILSVPQPGKGERMKQSSSLLSKHHILHDILFTIGILILASFLSFSFFHVTRSDPANIALIYNLALIIIARFTTGYLYGIISSLFCVVFINWCFTFPYFTVNFTLSGYPVTFLVMLSIALIVCTMTTQLKKQDKMILEREREINEVEKERIRANLLRAISHDLRTPLTSIIGSSDSFTENYKDLSDQEKLSLVSTINEDSHWLLNMVENLLSVTRIQDDTGTVKKEDEVVEEVVSEAIIRLKKRIPDIKIHVQAPEAVLIIPMDPLLIEQVLMNLMENAFVHSESTAPIDLKITEEADYVTFHVMDYGKGIDEHAISLILKGEYTAPKTSDTHRGMGIGLSICNTIVQAHGGQITARNHDSGAQFSFTLPKEEA